jgi:hypothetical protein
MPRKIPEKTLIQAMVRAAETTDLQAGSEYGMSHSTIRKWRQFAATFPNSTFALNYRAALLESQQPINYEAVKAARVAIAFLTMAIAQSDARNSQHIERAIEGVSAVSNLVGALK